MKMYKAQIFRISICITVLAFLLYSYIDAQNELTKWKIEIPQQVRQITSLQEEIQKIRYQIDQVENPIRLMELAQSSEFKHLKHPFVKDILTVHEGVALHLEKKSPSSSSHSIPLALGAK